MPTAIFGVDRPIPFSLTGRKPDGWAESWWWDASQNGIDFGNPDAVLATIQSQLTDGSIEVVSSWENRDESLSLRLWGDSLDDLAAGETALRAELSRAGWTQFAWTPDGGETTVHDVVYGKLEFTLDATYEQALIRQFTLTLTCLPFPRSADEVAVTSLPAPADGAAPTVTVVDDASTVEGWSTTSLVEVKRNLHPNGSCQTGTTYGWYPGANSTGVWASSPHNVGVTGGGSWVGMVQPVLTPAGNVLQSYVNALMMPAKPELPYSFQARTGVLAHSGGTYTGGFLARFYAGSSILAEHEVWWAAGTAMAGGSGTWTAPAGTTGVAIFPFMQFNNVAATGITAWAFDHVQIEQAAAPSGYFDGSMPAAGSTVYQYVGGAGMSPSVALQPASVALAGGHPSVTTYERATITHSAAVDLSTQPFLRLTGKVTLDPSTSISPSSSSMASLLSSLSMQLSLVGGAPGVGFGPALLDIQPDGTFTAYWHLWFSIGADGWNLDVRSSAGFGSHMTLSITGIATADGLPQIGSAMQGRRQLPVYGSARTQASLRIETADDTLGDATLVYTQPVTARAGFEYALRSYRSTGPATTSSASSVSGWTNPLATDEGSADTWRIDCGLLTPSPQVLYARLDVATAGTVTFNWSVTLASGDAPKATGTRTVALAAGAQFVPLGVIDPPRVGDGSTDSYVLKLWASTAETIEDGYLFDTTGNLSIIGTDSRSLMMLNSATLNEPQPTVWVGNSDGSGDPANDTDVTYAAWRSLVWEQHQFAPGDVETFLVTPGTGNARLSLRYPPRWGHHAARIDIGPATSSSTVAA